MEKSDKDKELVVPTRHTLTYEKYLKIDDLLTLQQIHSKPEEHDETLFIIIHQSYELWFKQILHEMKLCCEQLEQGQLMRVMHALKRIETIQKVLVHKVDILETMPPDDFNRFRGILNPASGFQSYQFREVEFRLGLKNTRYLRYYAHHEDATKRLEQALRAPSLYDCFFRFLHKKGYKIPSRILERDVTQPHELDEDIVRIFTEVYRHPYQHSEVYLALESLMDLDENFILWRYRHVAMVERMIGKAMGTGGSSGAQYLASTLQKRAFPEIWELRNRLTTGY